MVSCTLNDSSTEIMQRVEAHDEILFAGDVLTGWAPAQHDTKCTDTISVLNAGADQESELARSAQVPAEKWQCPASWCDRDTMLFCWHGHVICDVRRQALCQFQWTTKGSLDSVESVEPVDQPQEPVPDKQLGEAWDRLSPYCPEDAAAVQLSAFYEDPSQFLAAEESDGQCGRCGMRATCVRVHRVHRCPATHARWEEEMGAVEAIIRRGAQPATRGQRVWNGVRVWAPSVAVYVLWVKPWRRHMVQSCGAPVWPMYLGSVPSSAFVQEVQRRLGRDARLAVPDCMRVVYRIQARKEVPGDLRQVRWMPTECEAVTALRGWDPRDHSTPQQPHVRVPADVLHWAVQHTRYCLVDVTRWDPHYRGIPVRRIALGLDQVTWCGAETEGRHLRTARKAWEHRCQQGGLGVLLLLAPWRPRDSAPELQEFEAGGACCLRRGTWSLVLHATGPSPYRMPDARVWQELGVDLARAATPQ